MKILSRKGRKISPSLTMELTSKANEMKKKGVSIISFSAGEPDFTTPENISSKGIDAINQGMTKYTPASGLAELKTAIAKKIYNDYDVDYNSQDIVISNGAKQSIFNALFALINEGDEILIPTPYWVSYPEIVKLLGGTPVFIKTKEENNFKATKEDLNKYFSKHTKALILNNPCNPTGALYSKEELIAIGEFCVENNIFILSDEIYDKLVYDGLSYVSMGSLSSEILNQTIMINGMSKSFAMTGWRIGYLCSKNREIVNIIKALQSHVTGSPSSISQYASIEAINNSSADVLRMRKIFEGRRNLMISQLKLIKNISFLEPKGAFYIFVNMKHYINKEIKGVTISSTMDLANLILEEGKVSVVPGEGFGKPGYIRLSYSVSDHEIIEGMERIRILLGT